MSEHKNILLIFDFDGTLADTQPELDLALLEFSNANDLPHDPKKMAVGYVNPDVYDLGWGLPLSEQRPYLKAFNEYLRDVCAHDAKYMSALFAGVEEFLQQIQNDYICSIITARDRPSFLSIMNYHRLHDIFPHYRTSCCARERGYKIKPQADAVHCLLTDLQQQPEKIIVIGDTTSDIGMAANANAKSIGVLWGAHDRHTLQEAGADAIAESVVDLRDIIARL